MTRQHAECMENVCNQKIFDNYLIIIVFIEIAVVRAGSCSGFQVANSSAKTEELSTGTQKNWH